MAKLKVTNNATSLLATGITALDTGLSVTAGDEGKFPSLAAGEFFPITVVDNAANREIMHCTARSGVALTVSRHMEGTTARAFTAGARIDLRYTAAAIDTKADLDGPVFTGSPTAPTPAVGDRSQKIATTNFTGLMPAGAIIFGVMATPSGYLLCDGAAVSRATYAALFTAISTTFGAGNGTTTFNLPDLRGQFIRGVDNGRGIDVDRVAGSTQTGSVESHAHTASAGTDTPDHVHWVYGNVDGVGNHNHNSGVYDRLLSVTNTATLRDSDNTVGEPNLIVSGTIVAAGAHTHLANFNSQGASARHSHSVTVDAYGSGTETRPTNVALHGFIKY